MPPSPLLSARMMNMTTTSAKDQNQGQQTGDVGGRRGPFLGGNALFEGVERRGSDVAVDNTDGADGKECEFTEVAWHRRVPVFVRATVGSWRHRGFLWLGGLGGSRFSFGAFVRTALGRGRFCGL